jgi:hypothetical protein
MAKKRPEEILYKLKTEVTDAFFKANPVKKFPNDFLSKKVKEELADVRGLPNLQYKHRIRARKGRDHRHRRGKIDLKNALAAYEQFKKIETKMKYEIVVLPDGEFEFKMERKVQICPEKWPMPLEFDSFDDAKYVLYSRRKGQWVYELPKDKIAVKKAVAKYEKYLKEVREKLTLAFVGRGARKEMAELLAIETIKEKGINSF